MSNIPKNLLLALTLVCVIVLIVFCIQLIILNRGVEPVEPGSAASGDAQQGDADPDADSEEPSDGEGGDERDVIQVPPRLPPQGIRRELGVTSNSRLVIYSKEELFDFETRDFDWWFTYTGGGVATLEITFLMVGAQGVGAAAETFLNSYSGGTEASSGGEESIGGSQLRGYHVSAQHEAETYEAWVYTLLDSDLALVFVINYSNDQQKDALYEMLSTLEMLAGGLTNTGAADTGTPGTTGTGDTPVGTDTGGTDTGGTDTGGDDPDGNDPDETDPDEPDPDRPVVT